MPYTRRAGGYERASRIGHVSIASNPIIQERLRSYQVPVLDSRSPVPASLLFVANSLGQPQSRTEWVLGVDGSYCEVPVREEYPSTRIGYLQLAGVLLEAENLVARSEAEFIDPRAVRRSITTACFSMVFPGSNVLLPGLTTVKDSWRQEVFQTFREYRVERQSLLDILMLLVRFSEKQCPGNRVMIARCPASSECEARNIPVAMEGSTCSSCGEPLYPTDALRLHEEVHEEQTNCSALGRLMICLEHFILVGYRECIKRRRPSSLGSMGFMLDGTLAFYGPQSWLHTPMMTYLRSLRDDLLRQGCGFPIIVGVEKSGMFHDHASLIGESLLPKTLMILPDDYIYDRIVTFRSNPGAAYGRDTYYGQKFIYRTASGQLLTFTIPKTGESVLDPHHPRNYPLLPNTLDLLDRMGTMMYEGGLIPIALAHHHASIPQKIGSKVLRLLSIEQLRS